MADDTSVRTGIADVLDQAGRIDVLVNNAGIGNNGVVEEATPDVAPRDDEREPVRRRALHPGRAARHAGAAVGRHREHHVDRGPLRCHRPGAVRGVEVGARRPERGAGAGGGRLRRPGRRGGARHHEVGHLRQERRGAPRDRRLRRPQPVDAADVRHRHPPGDRSRWRWPRWSTRPSPPTTPKFRYTVSWGGDEIVHGSGPDDRRGVGGDGRHRPTTTSTTGASSRRSACRSRPPPGREDRRLRRRRRRRRDRRPALPARRPRTATTSSSSPGAPTTTPSATRASPSTTRTGTVVLPVPVVDRIDAVELGRRRRRDPRHEDAGHAGALWRRWPTTPPTWPSPAPRTASRTSASPSGSSPTCTASASCCRPPSWSPAWSTPTARRTTPSSTSAGTRSAWTPRPPALAAAFEASGLVSTPQPAIMRFKYRKLTMNLANLLDALVSRPRRHRRPAQAGHRRGRGLLRRRRHRLRHGGGGPGPPRGPAVDHADRRAASAAAARRGSRFARGAAANEIDWLNGEIVLLGRQHGVPTPVNAMLQRLARTAAGRAPGAPLAHQRGGRSAGLTGACHNRPGLSRREGRDWRSDMDEIYDVVVIGAGTGRADGGGRGRRRRRPGGACWRRTSPAAGPRRPSATGYHLNQGPHALYLGGPAEAVLRELGVDYPRPAAGRAVLRPPRATTCELWPVSASTLARSGLLSARGKLRFGNALRRHPEARRRRPRPRDGGGSGWPASTCPPTPTPCSRSVTRVGTYSNAFDHLSADAAITQLQMVADHGVLYLDGGWQRLVDGLRAAAIGRGVEVRTHATVRAGARRATGRGRGRRRRRCAARAVVVAAGGPDVAARLLGVDGAWADRLGPPSLVSRARSRPVRPGTRPASSWASTSRSTCRPTARRPTSRPAGRTLVSLGRVRAARRHDRRRRRQGDAAGPRRRRRRRRRRHRDEPVPPPHDGDHRPAHAGRRRAGRPPAGGRRRPSRVPS